MVREDLSHELRPLSQPWENVREHQCKEKDSSKCKPEGYKTEMGAYLEFDGQEDLCDWNEKNSETTG